MDLKKQNKNLNEIDNCYLAIKNKDMITLKSCVEKYGVDFTYKNGTLLHQAILENNFEAVNYLLNVGANANSLYDNCYTPLILAIDNRQFDIARLLIEKDADVNLKDGFHNSPLSKAILRYNGDNDILESLISRGANPNQELVNGYTPMELAKSMKLSNLIQKISDKYESSANKK